MIDARMSPFNRMPNIVWLIANADGRYPHLPRLKKELAEIFRVHQSQISRMMPPGAVRSATESEVEKWLAASRLREVHPGFQASWLDWPPQLFLTQMQAISFGRWEADQPLDGLSAALPPLAGASLITGGELARLLGRAPQRGDLGADITPDIAITGSVKVGSRFGIRLDGIEAAMGKALWQGGTTCILLFRPVRKPLFEAARFVQRGCLHLLSSDWRPLEGYPPPPRLRSRLMVVIAPTTGDQRQPYGFAASNLPERLELVLAVFGRAIAPLHAWSEKGGEGLTEQRECLRLHMAQPSTDATPKIVGRLLIDVIPPSPR
ncbi:MAG: hypothetical protein ACK5X3_21985 [Pseudomonadota bacterium]